MEKINALIEKLQELKNSGADLSAISYYVQLLQAEVLHVRTLQHQQQMQSSQRNTIAVIMPVQQPVAVSIAEPTAAQTTTLPSNKPLEVVADPEISSEAEDINSRAARLNDIPTFNHVTPVEDINSRAANAKAPAPVVAPEPVVIPQSAPVTPAHIPVPEKPKPATLFDEIAAHVPTTPATPRESKTQEPVNGLSLNDRLRQQKVEVAQKLGDMPVHDLRHAIGINDKYQFIQELFRGDSDLYERSIKTINECGSLQEADYWLQREIKIIQGWEDDHHLVQQFYSLLRKRFS